MKEIRAFLILILAIFAIAGSCHADGATVSEFIYGYGVNRDLASVIGESRAPGLSALSNGSQTSAFAIKATVNVFTTVTTASADSARLPTKAAIARDVITIVNQGAGVLRVFPHVGGNVNGGNLNASLSVEAGGFVQCLRTSSAAWWCGGIGESTPIILTSANVGVQQSGVSGLTATGTIITDALQLTSVFNNVSTAAAGTGVKLWAPAAGVGICEVVRNGGANDLKLYPNSGVSAINGGAGGASITLTTAAKQIANCCYAATNLWLCTVATGT